MLKFLWVIIFISISSLVYSQKGPLKYHDDFNTIDESFWTKTRGTFKNNLAYFHPHNVKIKEEKLELVLKIDHRRKGRFVGAQLKSKKLLRYGKYEIRVKPAKGAGLLNAFFLMGTSGEIGHEIDIEFMGNNPKRLLTNYWDKDGKEFPKKIKLGFDASKKFHTYSFLWTPENITWYVDGKEIRQEKRRIPDEPMHLYINLWVSVHKHWAGEVNKKKLPLKAYFDELKIYSLD